MASNDTIADVALRSRRDLIDRFSHFGATGPDASLTYQPQRHAERRALSYLLGRGVMKLTDDGRYWVDAHAADTWRRENLTRTAFMIGGALAAVVGVVAWRRYRGRDNS